MSVINDVLRDLDARRRNPTSVNTAAGLPAVKAGSRRRLLLLLLLAVSLGLLAATLVTTRSLPAPLLSLLGGSAPAGKSAAMPAAATGAAAGASRTVVVGGAPEQDAGTALTMDTGVGKFVGSALKSAGGAAVDAITRDPRAREHAKGVLGQVAAKMGDDAPAPEAGRARAGKPAPVLLTMPAAAGEGEPAARTAAEAAAPASPARAAAQATPAALPAPERADAAEQAGLPATAAASAHWPTRKAEKNNVVEEGRDEAGVRTIRRAGASGPAGDYEAALALLQEGRTEAGADKLQRLLAQHPQHLRARETLIAALIDLRRIDEAARLASEGLALNPNQPGLAMTLARLQLERGDLGPAIATLEGKQAYAGARADYHAFLAALLQRAGRHRDAIEHYTVALRAMPGNGVWWVGMGISWQGLGQNAEAEEAFRRARSAGNLSPELQAFVGNRLAQFRRN